MEIHQISLTKSEKLKNKKRIFETDRERTFVQIVTYVWQNLIAKEVSKNKNVKSIILIGKFR